MTIFKSKLCKQCGSEFTLTAGRQMYCSDECRHMARNTNQAACARQRRRSGNTTPLVKRRESITIHDFQHTPQGKTEKLLKDILSGKSELTGGSR